MKNRWIWAALAVAAVSVLGIAGCSKSSETEQKSETMAVRGALTVGIINGEDAYASKEGNTFTGVEPEIARRLGKSLHLKVSYKEASGQDELLEMLDQGKIDLAMGRLPQPDSESEQYLLSTSYGRGGMYLVTDRYWYIDNLAAIDDDSVINVSKSVSASIRTDIDGLSRMEVHDSGNRSDMAANITGKLCAAGICTEREALAIVKDNPGAIQANELLNSPRERYSAYVLKDRPQLAGNLNAVIGAYLDERAQGLLETEEETLGSSDEDMFPKTQQTEEKSGSSLRSLFQGMTQDTADKEEPDEAD